MWFLIHKTWNKCYQSLKCCFLMLQQTNMATLLKKISEVSSTHGWNVVVSLLLVWLQIKHSSHGVFIWQFPPQFPCPSPMEVATYHPLSHQSFWNAFENWYLNTAISVYHCSNKYDRFSEFFSPFPCGGMFFCKRKGYLFFKIKSETSENQLHLTL